jgi:hypothetical protein
VTSAFTDGQMAAENCHGACGTDESTPCNPESEAVLEAYILINSILRATHVILRAGCDRRDGFGVLHDAADHEQKSKRLTARPERLAF